MIDPQLISLPENEEARIKEGRKLQKICFANGIGWRKSKDTIRDDHSYKSKFFSIKRVKTDLVLDYIEKELEDQESISVKDFITKYSNQGKNMNLNSVLSKKMLSKILDVNVVQYEVKSDFIEVAYNEYPSCGVVNITPKHLSLGELEKTLTEKIDQTKKQLHENMLKRNEVSELGLP